MGYRLDSLRRKSDLPPDLPDRFLAIRLQVAPSWGRPQRRWAAFVGFTAYVTDLRVWLGSDPRPLLPELEATLEDWYRAADQT